MTVQTIDATPAIGLTGDWVSTPVVHSTTMGALVAMSRDRTKLYFRGGKDLWVSTDEGATRTLINTFPENVEGLSFLDADQSGKLEVIVATQALSSSPGYFYKSTGWNGLTATSWTKTFTTIGGYVRSVWGNHRWSSYGSRVVTAEYGVQSQSDAATVTSYATRAYLSEDYGQTFRVILNLTDKFSGTYGLHVHAIAYDPYWDRIWLTYGDTATHLGGTGTNIMYTDDLGANWVTVPLPPAWTGQSSYPFQDTTIFVTERAVGFMPDGVPYAPVIMPRKGYRVMGDLMPGPVWAGKTGAQGISFCANKAYPLGSDPSPVLLTNQGIASQAPPGTVYMSPDGHGASWVEIWRITGSTSVDTIGFVVGPTVNGNIYWSWSGSTYKATLMKYLDDSGAAKIPAWAVAPTGQSTLTTGATTANSQTVSYTAITSAQRYKLEYKKSADSTWTLFSDTLTALTATVGGLDASTAYQFRVSGGNAGGFGPTSAVKSATTSAPSGNVDVYSGTYTSKAATGSGNTGTDNDGSAFWSDTDGAYAWNTNDGASSGVIGLVCSKRPSSGNANYYRLAKAAVNSKQYMSITGRIGVSAASTIQSPTLLLCVSDLPATAGGVNPATYYMANFNSTGNAVVSRFSGGTETVMGTSTAAVNGGAFAVGNTMALFEFYEKSNTGGVRTLGVSYDGVEILTVTDSSPLAGTFVGWRTRRNATTGTSPQTLSAAVKTLA